MCDQQLQSNTQYQLIVTSSNGTDTGALGVDANSNLIWTVGANSGAKFQLIPTSSTSVSSNSFFQSAYLQEGYDLFSSLAAAPIASGTLCYLTDVTGSYYATAQNTKGKGFKMVKGSPGSGTVKLTITAGNAPNPCTNSFGVSIGSSGDLLSMCDSSTNGVFYVGSASYCTGENELLQFKAVGDSDPCKGVKCGDCQFCSNGKCVSQIQSNCNLQKCVWSGGKCTPKAPCHCTGPSSMCACDKNGNCHRKQCTPGSSDCGDPNKYTCGADGYCKFKCPSKCQLPGYSCQDGICLPGSCENNSQCPPNFECIKGKCVVTAKCTNDHDCASGQKCICGTCVQQPCKTKSNPCPSGYNCIDGACVPASDCTKNSQCGKCQKCDTKKGHCVPEPCPDPCKVCNPQTGDCETDVSCTNKCMECDPDNDGKCTKVKVKCTAPEVCDPDTGKCGKPKPPPTPPNYTVYYVIAGVGALVLLIVLWRIFFSSSGQNREVVVERIQ
jgi:hypothetical protein